VVVELSAELPMLILEGVDALSLSLAGTLGGEAIPGM
jgi:hypothetical protein